MKKVKSPGNRKMAVPAMPAPEIKVSWGEVLDKITILEIKQRRLTSAGARANVSRELAALMAVAGKLTARPRIAALKAELKTVNEALWDVEDHIRLKETAKDFDQAFTELARSVYLFNDRRSAIKRRINRATGSDIVEEKQYAPYRRRTDPPDPKLR